MPTYANRGTVYRIVTEALKALTVEAVEQLRNWEVASRLDQLQLGVAEGQESKVPQGARTARLLVTVAPTWS